MEFIDNLVVKADVESALSTHSLTDTPPIQPSFMTFVTNTLKSQVRKGGIYERKRDRERREEERGEKRGKWLIKINN